uniref:Uncharacterized protein n=1 Tax=Pseudo-nitzschia australis TaxID=44445 RepID=A0A7S4EJA1_9STRA|eukprot:CAMPEP_0168290368 /NCGR_PEP_ID=MMETSP0142_2-20121227/5248_1 /TAXON_ID=44445 /ORGANISM="Pseudo-nitzschia australis, Strain 10249 10 AB" /LENGTH=806 /DNA_ID=CAMNT_0008237389 /DNA_START=1 /DNA_END=2421 /DNA_ORIENTATION=+
METAPIKQDLESSSSTTANVSTNANANANTNTNGTTNDNKGERRRKRRWGAAAASSATTTAAAAATSGPVDSKAKALALKASISARLAALRSKTAAAASNKRPLPQPTAALSSSTTATSATPATATSAPVAKRAKHYELDMTVTGPTFAKDAESIAKPKPKVNPYLAHRLEPSEDDATSSSNKNIKLEAATAKTTSSNSNNNNNKHNRDTKTALVKKENANVSDENSRYIDARLEAAGHDGSRKHRRRELRFVEPGTFVDIAERKRQRAANAESAGFASGRKTGQYFRSTTMAAGSGSNNANYYGTTEVLDDVEDRGILAPRAEIGNINGNFNNNTANANQNQPLRAMPLVVEWWDMELLPSKLKKQVASCEGKALSKATQSQLQQQLASSVSTSISTSTDQQQQHQEGAANEATAATAATTTEEKTTSATAVVDKAQELRKKCEEQASLSFSKTAGLIQHIVPIPPPGEAGKKAVEPVLYLTKKEQKRARKRRREQKQRELQDLQAVGLIEAPEPRLTLQNFIRVMGDQAYVDPSQMEQKVMEQVQKRQRAHMERNEEKKLTKQQKAEKLRNKLLKDSNPTANSTGAIHVALFFVKNASHPYHRTKIDLNAQQLNITGGVVECNVPSVACVICEGGPKAIQKYKRLMLVRMKWKGPDDYDDDEEEESEEEEVSDMEMDNNEEQIIGPDGLPIVKTTKKKKHKFDKENKCELVWTGMAIKRQFKGFVFQHCETSAQAHKVLKSKGVGQYWDQLLAHASGSGDSMHLKLVDSDDDDDSDEDNDDDNDTNKPGVDDMGTDVNVEMTEA